MKKILSLILKWACVLTAIIIHDKSKFHNKGVQMEKRIFYHDTDSGGVVYYANYLKYLEEARTEFLEQKGLSVAAFCERGFLYAVRTVQISYKTPARYGDVLTCDAALVKVSAAQIFFKQKIFQKDTGLLVVEADVALACLTKDFKPVQIPDDLKESLMK